MSKRGLLLHARSVKKPWQSVPRNYDGSIRFYIDDTGARQIPNPGPMALREPPADSEFLANSHR